MSSLAMMASASDNLNDVVVSVMVLVGAAASRWGIPIADPTAGLLVSAFVFRAAWAVVGDAVRHFIGGSASEPFVIAVHEAVSAVRHVLGIEQVVAGHVGPQARADIHMAADEGMPLSEVHQGSRAGRHAVAALDGVDQAYFRVEPRSMTDLRRYGSSFPAGTPNR